MISKDKREQCRKLRRQGFSLGRIIKIVKLPKITVYDQVKDIEFSRAAKIKFKNYYKKAIDFASGQRRGRCWPGRTVIKPTEWSSKLIYTLSHFLFDGRITRNCCDYYNRSICQIKEMQKSVKFLFGLKSKIHYYKNDVKKIGYCYVELGEYVINKVKELKCYILDASINEKRIFLKAFFDDEGCISWEDNYKRKRVRGYQHSREILELIKSLLSDFNIESKINKSYTEIYISQKVNIIKFQEEINFSSGIYINPDRKNGIWKKKIEKRKILEKAINAYLD